MLNQPELDTKAHKLLDLKAEAETLSNRIKALEDALKSEMEERGEYTLSGEDWEITWNMVTSRRFNQSTFKEQNPDMFERYLGIQESRRFLLKEKEVLND